MGRPCSFIHSGTVSGRPAAAWAVARLGTETLPTKALSPAPVFKTARRSGRGFDGGAPFTVRCSGICEASSKERAAFLAREREDRSTPRQHIAVFGGLGT